MNYWKKIKIKNLEIIQTKSLEYIKNNKDQFSLGSSFQPIKFDDFIKAVPEIMDAFTEHGLTPKTVAAYFMLTNTDGNAHRDSYTDPARINIPILNCENSWTNFYVLKDSSIKPKLMLNKKGQPYQSYDPNNIIRVDRVQITEPTIIRPLEIHSIEMDETKVPRITLTISTNPTPEFLLEDNNNE